jgi:hypothetical protein
MKKKTILTMAAACLLTANCGTMGTGSNNGSNGNVLGDVFASILQNGTLGNIITSVIGAQTVTAADLVGAWNYTSPGCAFTSEKLLAKAGGEVVASQVKNKILPYYQQMGINSSNTKITFSKDGTYTAAFRGTPMSGKWSYDQASSKVVLSGMLININCYAKRNSDGIALLFEAKKLLSLLQVAAAASGNSNIQTVAEISKSYDGMRLGFDFKH